MATEQSEAELLVVGALRYTSGRRLRKTEKGEGLVERFWGSWLTRRAFVQLGIVKLPTLASRLLRVSGGLSPTDGGVAKRDDYEGIHCHD